MFGANAQFIRLASEHETKPFDCGDDDLNEYLAVDAKLYLNQLLAVTYLVENDIDTIAFFSVSNDKIAYQDFPNNSQWKKMRRRFDRRKHLKSYPCVKIGRLGVSKPYSGQDYGTKLINYIKSFFTDKNKTGCRFLTVDAYRSALGFYEKNGFDYLTDADVNEETRLMFFDLTLITNE